MSSRVLIFGYLGHGNFGDCLLLDAALARITKGAKVTVVSVAGRPERISPAQKDRLSVRFVANRSGAHALALSRAQELHCIGGSCFIEGKSGFFINQLIAAAVGKHIIWHNAGIEANYAPSSFQKAVFRRTLGSLSVRDSASRQLAERHWGIVADIHPDAAFQSPTLRAAIRPNKERDSRLVVSLKETTTPLEDKLVWVERAQHALGYSRQPLVMPACPLDTAICRVAASRLNAEFVLADWLQQVENMASNAAFVGERLHHQIAAYVLGLNVFAIRYMEKNVNAFEDIPNDRVVFFPPQTT